MNDTNKKNTKITNIQLKIVSKSCILPNERTFKKNLKIFLNLIARQYDPRLMITWLE